MISIYKSPLEIENHQTSYPINNKTKENLSQKTPFSLDIDRFFVCVEDGTKAVLILQKLGLYCPNTIITSKSQGTQSQIFFFDNIYMAIIWLTDDLQRSDAAINFHARVNWQVTRTSLFGIGLSRKKDLTESEIFRYPVDDLTIDSYIAYSQQNQRNEIEPLSFILPDRLRYSVILNKESTKGQKYLSHPLGVKKITEMKVSVQAGKRRNSPIIEWIKNNHLLGVERASMPLMEITFDDGIRGEIFDARPVLPMIIRY